MNLRVVIDPGVFVSAALVSSGPPARVVQAWRAGRFELVVSPSLIGELGEVLVRPKFTRFISPAETSRLLRLLNEEADCVPDPEVIEGVTGDPGDDYLAALVISSEATHLVTGDHTLQRWTHERVTVVSPREFLDLLESLESASSP